MAKYSKITNKYKDAVLIVLQITKRERKKKNRTLVTQW